MRKAWQFVIPPMLVLGTMACGDNMNNMMTGPSTVPNPGNATSGATSFLSVSPSGGSTDVASTTPIVIRFNHPMGSGMDKYVMLHLGTGIDGPQVPMSYRWSGDRSLLTCFPDSSLLPHTQYAIHMGAGMKDASGNDIDWSNMPMMGGKWVMPGMMTGGVPPEMIGPGWQGPNGSDGMVFVFGTA